MGRFIVGMEMHSYSEFGILFGHVNIVNGTWSLFAYMVATWHGIPSSGRSPFPEHTCKYQILLTILNILIPGNFVYVIP